MGASRAVRARRPEARPAGPRVLHLDAFSGIAGNMFLGALLDLGLSRRELEQDLAGLGVAHALRVRSVRRGALGARYVEVLVPGTGAGGHDRGSRRGAAAGAPHAQDPEGRHARHVHDPDRTHAHHAQGAHGAPAHSGHGVEGGRAARPAALAHAPSRARRGHTHSHGRRYAEIRRLLERARLAPAVRERSLAIFEALAGAEARVHRVRLADVHFHEVGAVDAIVDVTAAAIGLERLGITRVTCSPVALGHGSVETRHGRLPLPAPATLELLRGVPTVPAHVPWETVTPTGAAILRVVVDEFRTLPALVVERIGHGAGDDRPGPMPNVLRAVLGREAGVAWDRILVLETNLDDLVPEHFDYLMERLFEAGALDVSLQHLQMKKNRPGFLVRVLARPSERLPLTRLLFAESTAIGVRAVECDRLLLPRETRQVATPYGRIGVKLVRDGAGRVEVSAEYDDCKRAARRRGVALREVVRAAEQAARDALA